MVQCCLKTRIEAVLKYAYGLYQFQLNVRNCCLSRCASTYQNHQVTSALVQLGQQPRRRRRYRCPHRSCLLNFFAYHTWAPERLIRVSFYTSAGPFFGRSGGNHFDSPEPAGPAENAACYLGQTRTVALVESVLHDAEPVQGRNVVVPKSQAARYD